METINLSQNHQRVLSSTIYLVENLLYELKNSLETHAERNMLEITDSQRFLEDLSGHLNQINEYVKFLKIKYQLKPLKLNAEQLIMSGKSKIWEILCDTDSKRMSKYGKFPTEIKDEFDKDIKILAELVDRISNE